MLTQTAIALAAIIAIASSVHAADNQPSAARDQENKVLINRCVPDYGDALCKRWFNGW